MVYTLPGSIAFSRGLNGEEFCIELARRNTRGTQQPQRTILAERAVNVVIASDPVTVEIALDEESEGIRGELMLSFVGVEIEEFPTGYYEVYVNLGEEETPAFTSNAYVGNMTFFGATSAETIEYEFSLLSTERRLRAADSWDGQFARDVGQGWS